MTFSVQCLYHYPPFYMYSIFAYAVSDDLFCGFSLKVSMFNLSLMKRNANSLMSCICLAPNGEY